MAETIDWESIGLTKQQAGIMQAALIMNAKGLHCTPVELQRAYEKFSGNAIQKPNFFAQLKTLTGMSMLTKQGGEYVVNLFAISKSIEMRKKELIEAAEKLETQRKNFKKLTTSLALKPQLPLVQYQSIEKYFGLLAEQLSESELFCNNSIFPWTSFSYPIAQISGSPEYFTRLREALEKGTANIWYITAFNCQYLTKLALKATQGNRKLALQECLRTLDNMKSQLKLFPNLHIKYVPKVINLHFVILKPGDGEPFNIYLFIFGKPGEIQNGVIINSPEMAENVYKMFNDEFNRALDMRSPKAAWVYKMLEKQFRSLLSGKRQGHS
jgi:hypothetical protein